MFTIRFVTHDGERYQSFACRSYFVRHNGEGIATVRMHFPDGEYQEETVGDTEPWGVAYITNADSRTIDVVRAMKAILDT
jgi:hypothetical protein